MSDLSSIDDQVFEDGLTDSGGGPPRKGVPQVVAVPVLVGVVLAFALLFASSYFSVITPQAGSQNIIFAASGYLGQRELYIKGLVMTLFFMAVFLIVGSPWILLVAR